MKRIALMLALLLADNQIAEARLPRSRQAIAEFKRTHPCPATQHRSGPCPGWQIDHIQPLKCNGADAPENMHWMTVSDHKDKTRRESGWCLHKK